MERSVNTEYLLSDIGNKYKAKQKPQKQDSKKTIKCSTEDLDTGYYSKFLSYVPTSIFGSSSNLEFPDEEPEFAAAVLNQNWAFKCKINYRKYNFRKKECFLIFLIRESKSSCVL